MGVGWTLRVKRTRSDHGGGAWTRVRPRTSGAFFTLSDMRTPASAAVLHSVSVVLQASPVAPCLVRSRLPYKRHASDKAAVMPLAGRQSPLASQALSEGDG